MTLKCKAYAKINLYLEVVGKRENGYHDLVTVMQSVSLADILTFTRREGEGVVLDAGDALPADDSNLVIKAAKAYFAASGAPFGVDIRLEKHIPMAAGMGGGSADAAATLRALNTLDQNRFSDDALVEIAAEIGADVPFCLLGGTRLCRGIGEVMTPVSNKLNCALVVAVAGEGVSTPTAFGALDKLYDDFKDFDKNALLVKLLDGMEKGSISDTVSALFNRFEVAVEPMRPAVSALKKAMLENRALAAQMSGSGPSVFGIFADLAEAERAAKALSAMGARAYACELIKAL